MKHKTLTGKHRLTILDRLRGWHRRGDRKHYNYCGCPKGA